MGRVRPIIQVVTPNDRQSPTGITSGFWEGVTVAPHRLLMLDYDGTLVPFRADRMEPRLARETKTLLRDISRRTRIVVVSGRPVAELALMLEGLDIDLVGEHGWEERRRGGRTLRYPLPADTERGLEEAWTLARDRPWAGYVERKRASLMLHTRGIGEAEARSFEQEASALWGGLATGALDLRPVNGGFELRSRGADKGTAVLRLLAETPRDAVAVYIGDDETDEDAFAALAGRGVSIRVGAPRPTTAAAQLADLGAVAKFLARWRDVTR